MKTRCDVVIGMQAIADVTLENGPKVGDVLVLATGKHVVLNIGLKSLGARGIHRHVEVGVVPLGDTIDARE